MARSHEKGFCHLLVGISADGIQKLGRDARLVGAGMGMASAPHTWRRNLAYHSHVRPLVPCGGVTMDGAWLGSRANFFAPTRNQLGRNLLLQMPNDIAMADIGLV